MVFDKAKLHHTLVVVRRIKVWHLVVALIIGTSISIFLLRQNNLGMIERRNAVKSADDQNSDIPAALSELQRYVSRHMNTNLGKGVFLEHSYQRAYEVILAQAANTTNPNSAMYAEAERECQQEYTRHGVFSRYIECIQEKVKAIAPANDPLVRITPPPAELFTYNFVSPTWSPDLAGITLVITLLITVLLLLRVLGFVALRLLLRARKA